MGNSAPAVTELQVAEKLYLSGLLLGIRPRTELAPRLEALGLIEMGNIPASPESIAAFDVRVWAWRAKTRRLVCAGLWNEVEDCPVELRATNRPVFDRDYILTAAGRAVVLGET